MEKVAEVIELIASVSGSNDKQYILKKNENNNELKAVLSFIYNPYVRTGISKQKLAKALSMPANADDVPITYYEIIEYFTSHTTGSDDDLYMAASFIERTTKQFPNAVAIVKALITQDLKIGVTATTLNKVYGASFIPKIGCILGTRYEDVGEAKVGWPCIVTEKLDGIRRILVKENGVCRFYSRSGHEDTGLVEIAEQAKYLPNNRVYDGELLAIGSFKDSIALRQATNSLGASSGEKTGLMFNIFDMLPIQDFNAGKSEDSARVRKIMLGAMFNDEGIACLNKENWQLILIKYSLEYLDNMPNITSVPILGLVHNLSEVTPIVEKIWKRGGEGVMLNTAKGFYELKRSKELLKVKKTKELELQIVDFVEGAGKFDGMLGAVIVDYKGNKVGVGSGFTEAQRQHIWDNQEAYLHKYIEIETFGVSTNATGGTSLNCPIFKRFYGEVE